jgi:hypothetical protein
MTPSERRCSYESEKYSAEILSGPSLTVLVAAPAQHSMQEDLANKGGTVANTSVAQWNTTDDVSK